MSEAVLEHVNITVQSALESAHLFSRLFDWQVRWQGEAIHEGYSVHVGGEKSYVAFYQHAKQGVAEEESYFQVNGLNHVAVVVQDLDETERRVLSEGLTPYSHADYEPGRRFYFDTSDGVEVEVVSYA